MKQKIADFLVYSGLYGRGVQISKDDLEELKCFLEGKYKLDAYCSECETERVFSMIEQKPRRNLINRPIYFSSEYSSIGDIERPELGEDDFARIERIEYQELIETYSDVKKTFLCAKDESHALTFCCRIDDNHIIKYGQFPALANLTKNNYKKYRRILGKSYLDFNRGLGLHSHGIGAGSLVYLRRIFESLIEEAHQKAKSQPGWAEADYPNKMNEKILCLKEYLPDYLVENRNIYGLLSKGIHELSEEECNEIFPIVKVGIEFILDEKLEIEERERKKKETAALLQRLATKLG
ncbi:hypothetical protein IMZ08_19285 [Bacillus luteolus]|uniref:Uncharacterized protein n=1 Tax=Litchfieldia luteola TaxID=682179 RepID=A0ABR9QNV7_9BACI|nr:hypothetical protein [Cytobacillus luteolus]MBE4910185.1 hypothetical protein [Cytobacillus luteolus]MBP1942246.1 hypothetical protein [Cytobacillus luteolus]